MGLLTKSRTLSDDTEEEKGKGGFLNGLLGMGKYKKTPEEKEEIQEAKKLRGRLSNLKIKKYKNNRQPSYNDDRTKRRLEVGADFKMNNLPAIIFNLAQSSGEFRNAVGGRLSVKDRDKLRFIMRHKSYRVRKMDQQLNNRNEKKCKVSLVDLF